eukprot:scaffold76206_cov52-Phaeocystis_antarctica.AAC.5
MHTGPRWLPCSAKPLRSASLNSSPCLSSAWLRSIKQRGAPPVRRVPSRLSAPDRSRCSRRMSGTR